MTQEQRIAAWQLERLALGELDPATAARIEAAAETDPALRAQLASLAESNAEILGALPPARVAAEVQRRLQQQRRPARMWTLAPAAAFACLLVAAVWVGLPGEVRHTDPLGPEVTRAKGLSPRLVVYRQLPGGAERLTDGSAVEPHQVLQLAYVAAGRRYGALISIDGRGSVTLHLPASPGEAVALAPSGEVALPGAFELDDAPRFERFFLITTDAPFDASTVLEAARAQAASARLGAIPSTLPLPAGMEQTAFTVQKVSP